MKKRVFAIMLALVLAVSFCLPVFATFDPETRNSVVVVYICFDDTDGEEYGLGWGTGFFVGRPGEDPMYLVTNYHVVEDFVDLGEGDLVSIDGGSIEGRAKIHIHYDSRDYEEGYLVAYNSIKDLAIVKLAAPTTKRVPLAIMTPADSMVGSTVYALGYPGLAENIFANATTSWGKSDCTVTKGTVSRLFRTQGTGTASIQLDLDIKHGNSGGPLLTEDNIVIGVNTWAYGDDGEEINYAVSAEEVLPLLRQYNIDFTDGARAQSEPQDFTPTEPTKDPGLPLWAILLIAAIALAAIALVLVLVLGKKKAKPAPAAPQPMQPMQQPRPAQPSRRAVVRSLAPQHGGRVISLSAQPITIGRGQDCAIVYQSGTPGVSSRHCTLSFDAATGSFLLTDLQSTYGTFLQNGQKLTPNMPYRLNAGDQFYLGEPQNKLQLGLE